MNIRDVGIVSGIPELSALLTRPIAAYFVDRLRSAGHSNDIVSETAFKGLKMCNGAHGVSLIVAFSNVPLCF